MNKITILSALPAALLNTLGKKRPVILRVSASKIVINDGIASINKSINVICNGINGKAVLLITQNNDNKIV